MRHELRSPHCRALPGPAGECAGTPRTPQPVRNGAGRSRKAGPAAPPRGWPVLAVETRLHTMEKRWEARSARRRRAHTGRRWNGHVLVHTFKYPTKANFAYCMLPTEGCVAGMGKKRSAKSLMAESWENPDPEKMILPFMILPFPSACSIFKIGDVGA